MLEDRLLRYAIPFHCVNCQGIEESNLWVQKPIVSGENDLYEHIANLASQDHRRAVATSWEWKEKGKFSNITYSTDLSGNHSVEWRFVNAGLVLFDTQVGILWWEIENKTAFSNIEEMQGFSYAIKELARGNKGNTYRHFSGPIERMQEKIEQAKTNPDIQILEQYDSKNRTFLKGREKVSLFENVLNPLLEGLTVDSYFANRRSHQGSLLPDRCIPFIWGLLNAGETEEWQAANFAFKLGRCYNNQYSMPKKISEEDFYRPFEDSIWYASLEGCANIVFPTEKKDFYSNGGYKKRLDTYYYLFILNLGQYYSLLQLETEVADLPTDDKRYDARNTILEDMLDKIHVFNLKNMYSQVGHFTQHNEFYGYLRNRFFIHEMHGELETEVQSLYEMVERKQAKRSADRFKVISFISSLFVVVEIFANMEQIVEMCCGKGISASWQLVISALCVGAVACIGVIVWFLTKCIDNIHDKKKKNKFSQE